MLRRRKSKNLSLGGGGTPFSPRQTNNKNLQISKVGLVYLLPLSYLSFAFVYFLLNHNTNKQSDGIPPSEFTLNLQYIFSYELSHFHSKML